MAVPTDLLSPLGIRKAYRQQGAKAGVSIPEESRHDPIAFQAVGPQEIHRISAACIFEKLISLILHEQ